VVLSATGEGLKEQLVLGSAKAPTSWSFPLRLSGVTPSLNEGSGAVEFTGADGTVVAVIPPGFMVDSSLDKESGTGAVSTGVTYKLTRTKTGWVLGVDLDEDWLSAAGRVFPVVVDPTVTAYNAGTDDTFVSSGAYAGIDNSANPELLVGTPNAGADRNAAYLHFASALSALPNAYVTGAKLFMRNTWSASCVPMPASVYRVTSPWAGATTTSWPGPGYDAVALDTLTFAHGQAGCPTSGYDQFTLPADRVRAWVHGTESFQGLTVRASGSDSTAFKRFASADSAFPPYLEVTYAPEGAGYALTSPVFNPPVTVSSAGNVAVRVTNWGQTTWTPSNNYKLSYAILNSAGTVIAGGPSYVMPHNVGPHQSADVPISVAAITTPGTYTLRLSMYNPAGHSFYDDYATPMATYTFVVVDAPPYANDYWPRTNATVDTLTPSLWTGYYDPDNTTSGKEYLFTLCNGTPSAPTGCDDSGWITQPTWPVPAGLLAWGRQAFYKIQERNSFETGPVVSPIYFTPMVAQPEITSHLSGSADADDMPGVNPRVGNYTTSVTDASVQVAGPDLSVTRTYNSQDPRTSGLFGAGWSSAWDQRIVSDTSGAGMLVTLESGLQVRFARSATGAYTPPAGVNLTLQPMGSPVVAYVLRDTSGYLRTFNTAGRLVSITDADANTQTYTYDGSSHLTTVTDVASGRALRAAWTGNHISTVSTDAPAAGQPVLTWTYTYSGDKLTQVCTPLSAGSCTGYGYQASSFYRSVVSDDNPTAYWPLGESSGGIAGNVDETTGAAADGAYAAVTLGAAGAIGGSTDAAAAFAASTPSSVTLPQNLVNTSVALAAEVWFKTASGGKGVLFSEQNADLAGAPSSFVPILYVGTDGKLRGQFWHGSAAPIASSGRVDDNAWHHAVISGAVNHQELYLDGVQIGSIATGTITHQTSTPAMDRAHIGNGRTTAVWPATTATAANFPFTGSIDEVAFYRHPLGASQVAAHWVARTAGNRLTTVTEPGGFLATTVGYDGTTGRVGTLTDRDGAAWTLTAPGRATVAGQPRTTITVASTSRDEIGYTYDPTRGDRIVSRSDSAGSSTWEYNTDGFLAKTTDPNGVQATYTRDPRGNPTDVQTCRTATSCQHEYSGYHLNAADPLDPRNDKVIWQSDARSASAADTTYRTSYTLDAAGRTTQITYPKPAGQSTNPSETFTYTQGPPPRPGTRRAPRPPRSSTRACPPPTPRPVAV
jgi:YD repeat-containing protein